jgi:hypothetical protein
MGVLTALWSSARIRAHVIAVAALCAVALLAGGPAADAQTPYEPPAVLSAKALLPPDQLAGPLFQVDERVPTDGYLAHFALRSSLGTFPVPGRTLLKIRIEELQAIQQLNQTSQTQTFVDGLGRAAARPVEAVVNIVSDPVGTVESLPTGISRFFSRVEAGAQSIATAATDPSKTSQQAAQDTAQRVGDVTITALGFEQVRRQMAKSLGVDPYTTNPVLAQKLTDTAWVAFSARLGVDLLMSAVVPGSTFISLTSMTSDLVYDTPKADLILLNQQKLIRMGASETLTQALLKNRWYSVSVLTALVTDLERLAGVKGRPAIISLATTVVNEEEARFLAASVHLLARLNVTGVPLRELAARRTVVGITPGGDLVVPAPVDYLSWTEPIARLADRKDLRAARRGLWISGRMSALAHRELSRLRWAFHPAPSLSAAP